MGDCNKYNSCVPIYSNRETKQIHYCISTIIQKKMDLPQQKTPSETVLESIVHQKVK